MARTSLLALILALGAGTAALAQQGDPGANFLVMWDADSDGIVTAGEVQTRRGDLFTTFDADEDGQLSPEEFVLIDETRTTNQEANGAAQGRGQMVEEPDRALIDTNADGLVSREEFLAATPLWMGMRDRNSDGVITKEDFGRGG